MKIQSWSQNSHCILNNWCITLEQPDLSLSEDDEGARFAGAGLGFRARGFGAGFSVDGKNKHRGHLHQQKELKLNESNLKQD